MKLRSLCEKPAYSCVFEPQNVLLFEECRSKIPPLGIRILQHLESSGLDLIVIDDTSVLDTAPWTLPEPTIHFNLNQFKKETTNPVRYQQSYLELVSDYPSYHTFFLQMALKQMMGLLLQQYPPETIKSCMPVVSLATALFTQLNFELFF